MQDPKSYQQGEIILIDKPYGVTSFAVVSHIRWRLTKLLGIKKIKVGHAGTLDPLATGLLLIFTGKKNQRYRSIHGLR
jgi:tRNA pseudouridine55 synthase